MMRSFASRGTEELFGGGSPRKFRSFQAQAEQKLHMLDSAKDLNDLRVPPGNQLEKLGGDRRGQHSVRININGESAFAGETTALGTWKSSTTIEGMRA
jgi:proteic killer suppression protein